MIYHAVKATGVGDPEEAAKLRAEVAALEPLTAVVPVLASTLGKKCAARALA